MALPAELQELAASVSNWGRWGDDDEQGTQNLIDDAALRRGLAAVGAGRHVSLAIPLDQTSPQEGGAPGRIAPLRTMLSINQSYTGVAGDASFNDDTVVMAMSAGTHIDALGHVSYGGFLYNGFPDSTVSAGAGLTRCGADKIGPLMSRGVLLDLPAAMGVERLEPGYALTADDLDAAVDLGHARAGRHRLRAHRSDAAAARGQDHEVQPRLARPVGPDDPVDLRPRPGCGVHRHLRL